MSCGPVENFQAGSGPLSGAISAVNVNLRVVDRSLMGYVLGTNAINGLRLWEGVATNPVVKKGWNA